MAVFHPVFKTFIITCASTKQFATFPHGAVSFPGQSWNEANTLQHGLFKC